ncbi:MAG: GWxTD domain-containing protein [Bacteroidetes bacterium]|nr:MAG: GWxTD domain-containing protein [Bacteroidota bacterium]
MKKYIFYLLLYLGACFGLTNCVMFGLNVFNLNGNNTNSQPTQSMPNRPKTEIKSNAADLLTKRMVCRTKFLDNGDSIRIFAELEVTRLAEKENISTLLSEFSFAYGLLPNYNAREYIQTEKLKFAYNQIEYKDGNYRFNFCVAKKPTLSVVLVMEITDTRNNDKLVQDMVVFFTITKIREKYGLFDKNGKYLHFSKFFLNKDTFQIRDLTNGSKELFVRYFSQDFEAALPPMATQPRLGAKDMKVDSSFKITSHSPIHFSKKGLYLVQDDTTSYYGLTVYVSDRKYPKLSKVNDLIEPLIYITTQEERQQLQNTQEIKKEMDKLWLKLSQGNTRLAKFVIKNYYQRVKYSNQYFTTYKEGWKTDMGMIYIIYGAPNRIVRNNEAEYWFYTQNSNFAEIKFTFAKKPNQFTDDHYNLLRFPDYEQVWYPVVEQWRTGKI